MKKNIILLPFQSGGWTGMDVGKAIGFGVTVCTSNAVLEAIKGR
jgi:hypothetical protein